ncbi:MAG: peptide-methionine (R)-S-oxide reductase MsrB [Candidatus Obscuribacterales bacterium]|nr:peptide-methionine (R)-S-oxide reductase MsrB [Candidatus Obscuribacterales bacterium]
MQTQKNSLILAGGVSTKTAEPKPEKKKMVEKIKKTDKDWQDMLTHEQFEVTRKKGTERAFTGGYWDNHEPGIYKCICCGNELFSGEHKFDSGTGWPSFWAPFKEENVGGQTDTLFKMNRQEVICSKCDAHLGHVLLTAQSLQSSDIASIPAP